MLSTTMVIGALLVLSIQPKNLRLLEEGAFFNFDLIPLEIENLNYVALIENGILKKC